MKNFVNTKFNSQILALASAALFASACSMKSQTASISIKIPGKPSNAIMSHVSGSMSVGGTALPPAMSLGDVNCLFVNVIAMDIPPAHWDNGEGPAGAQDYKIKVEKALQGEPCGYAGVTSKVVPFTGGSSLSLNVPVGQNRIFQLMGMKIPGGACSTERDAQTFFASLNAQINPTELGRVITNVNGSMSINLNGRFDETRNSNHCSINGPGKSWYFDPVHKVASGKPIYSASYGSDNYFIFENIGSTVQVLRVGPNGTTPITGDLGAASATSYDITVDPSGSVIASYTLGMTVYVKKMVAEGVWTNMGTPPSTPYSPIVCRIASDSTGNIFYGCNQGTSYTIHVGYYNGTTWAQAPATGTTPSFAGKIAMAVGPDNNAMIAAPMGSAIKVFKVNSSAAIVGAGPSQFGYSTAAPSSQISLAIKPDGAPIVAFVDGATIKVGDCMEAASDCSAAADTWTSRDITGLTNVSGLVMKMNMNWEPVAMFYSEISSVPRAQISRLNVSGGFVWQPIEDPLWLTPDDSVNSNAWIVNSNALGLTIDDFGVTHSIISHPVVGTAYIKF